MAGSLKDFGREKSSMVRDIGLCGGVKVKKFKPLESKGGIPGSSFSASLD